MLAPPTLLAIFVGSHWLQSLLLCIGGALGWEWSRICGGGAGLRGWRWALPAAAVVVLAVTFWISEPAGAAALLVATCCSTSGAVAAAAGPSGSPAASPISALR